MIKLIQLEWTKHSIGKYIRNAVIITVVMLGLMLLISSDPSTGEVIAQTGKSTVYALTELFLNMSYLVFTSVMLATFVVGEYENKLIQLMFSYPIRRRHILLAKILAVCIFSFLVLLVSKLFVCGVLVGLRSAEATGIHMGYLSFWSNTLSSAAISVCSGCISLLVGMKMKSSKATLISAFVIMLAVLGVTQGNVLPFTAADALIGYVLQFLGAAAAVIFTIHGMEKEDVM